MLMPDGRFVSRSVISSQCHTSMTSATPHASTKNIPYLTCSDAQFDATLECMSMQGLVETITTLQSMMSQEQRQFEDINTRLAALNCGEDAPEHIALSTELMKSQTLLNVLMGRNMKCFMQQTENQNKALLVSTVSKSAAYSPNDSSQRKIHVIKKSPDNIMTSGDNKTKINMSQHSEQYSNASKSDSISMNSVKNMKAPPWRKLPPNEPPCKANGGCDQNCDVKSPIQAGNSNPVTSNGNKRNNSASSGTNFSIRSSTGQTLKSPCKDNKENEISDDSERINFSAAFSMFETHTLPSGTKNKRNFQVPSRLGVSDEKSDCPKTIKSPSTHGNIDFQYYTLPNRPKKTTTKMEFSPAPAPTAINLTTTKHSQNTHTDNKTPVKHGPDSKELIDTPPTARTTPVFRSHVSTIIPSPPKQASYSPSQNIQWPLVNKNKAAYTPKSKSQVGNRHLGSPSLSSSPGGQGASPDYRGPTVKSNGYWSPSAGSASSPRLQNQESQVNQQNGTSTPPVVSASKLSFNQSTVPPQQTVPITNQNPPSTVISTNQKKQEIKIIPVNNNPASPVSLSNKKLVYSSTGHKLEASFKPANQESESSFKPANQSSDTSFKKTNHNVVPNQIAAPVIQELTNGHANKKVVNDEKITAKPSVSFVASATDEVTVGAQTSPTLKTEDEETLDDKVKNKVTLINWDPTILLKDLYQVKLMPDIEDDSSYINMEGYMEKLPTNKKKATLLKTWKRRYFKSKDGKLYYFESRKHVQTAELSQVQAAPTFWEEQSNAGPDKASAYFQLMGGSVEELGGRMLGVDDGRGRYLVVRCPTDKEYDDWIKSLNTQTGGNIRTTYMKPLLSATPHSSKKIVVIDIGSCSVRAGILGEKPSLPSVFFPTIVTTDKSTGAQTFGIESYKPDIRTNGNITFPVRPSFRIDKSVDMDVMSGLFRKIYNELGVNPKHYWVMFSAPSNLSDKLKEQFMDILIKEYYAPGVNIVNQSLLALYSYNAKTGVVVDIGDRLEIVPVTDGYVVEGGVTKQLYGGHRVGDALNSALTERKYHFFTDAEYLLVRLIMEKLCFISENYNQDLTECTRDPKYFQDGVSLIRYELPEGSMQEVSLDLGRFKAPEGLFNTELWGMDNLSLHKLVQEAVQASPLDTRREMWRSIYLSGGATMLPGFADRLQAELDKIAPSSIVVQVHASPHRYHAAFIGASTLAGLTQFEQSCITNEEWLSQGPKILRKWHMY